MLFFAFSKIDLLDNGANIATEDQDGESAIHKAVRGCHHKTLKVLIGTVPETQFYLKS